ncbi:MAG: Clp protease ClpP [Muribaculaceae bacterium]|nr:Clp protease ClpP [Muribaculaceae bacterium]
MPKNTYHISLKGYVGGEDFDRSKVDRTLAENSAGEVNVLIDSLGGSLATGLSVSVAFRNHGNVNVHFVGLNASAATIASLGAKHISMDAGAMYLVHQCSTAFFEWGSLNSAQFDTLIADCEKIKTDLDKLDLNCARLYAARCKRKPEELLALMKAGGWLSAQEALEWGFIDEITSLDTDTSPALTDTLASAMASAGMPIPNIPLSEADRESPFARFLSAVTSFFKPNTLPVSMLKTYTFLSALFADKPITVNNGFASISTSQLDAIENALSEKDRECKEHKATIAERDSRIAELEAKIAKLPAEDSRKIVDDGKSQTTAEPKNPVEAYVDTCNSARKLFDEV